MEQGPLYKNSFDIQIIFAIRHRPEIAELPVRQTEPPVRMGTLIFEKPQNNQDT